MCDIAGKVTRPLKLTHSGLAFVDDQTKEEWTIEYNMNPINYTGNPVDSMVPHAVWNKSKGMYDFEWLF